MYKILFYLQIFLQKKITDNVYVVKKYYICIICKQVTLVV